MVENKNDVFHRIIADSFDENEKYFTSIIYIYSADIDNAVGLLRELVKDNDLLKVQINLNTDPCIIDVTATDESKVKAAIQYIKSNKIFAERV